ncbi:hypothetical protein MNB_SV-13-2214 [hydrothermal vent metagenome]|uniref:Uncharacterized protein n=1 Tax=hydrothermal vent metagenome TaxID=652676 RepID=A0A1W1CZD7_9ZZZZ
MKAIINIYTQYTYEKKWTKTSEKEALRMISEEMPDTDAEGTLKYIVSQISKGKTITLGTCKFRNSP